MPKLRERCFPNFEIVGSDEVSLNLLGLVRGVEITTLGAGKESIFTKGLLFD